MTYHIELIGHLAYLLIALSYAARNIVWLRLLTLPACIFGIVFGLYLNDDPIWVIVFWNSLFLAINCGQLFVTWRNAAYLNRHQDAERLMDFLYPMTRSQISQLISFGKIRNTEASEVLLSDGSFPDKLFLVLEGAARIWKGEEQLATCGPGSLLGDISYLTRKPCSATVIADTGARIVAWDTRMLRKSLDDRPGLQAVFSRRLAQDVSTKLIRKESEQFETEELYQLS